MADLLVTGTDSNTPAGAVYNRPPAQKRRPMPAGPKTPTTLSDLGGEAAVSSASSRRAKSKGTLTKISEAAEWADESTHEGNSSRLDDELEALWAEAGISGSNSTATSRDGESGNSKQGGGVSSTAAAAVAAAAAARKASGAIGPSTAVDFATLAKGADPAQGRASSTAKDGASEPEDSEDDIQVAVVDSGDEKDINTVAKIAADAAPVPAGIQVAKIEVSDEESSEDDSSDDGEVVAYLPTPARADASPLDAPHPDSRRTVPAKVDSTKPPKAIESEEMLETLLGPAAPGNQGLELELLALQDHSAADRSVSDDPATAVNAAKQGRPADSPAVETDAQNALKPQSSSPWPQTSGASKASQEIWQCSSCRLDNTASSEECAECEAPRFEPSGEPSPEKVTAPKPATPLPADTETVPAKPPIQKLGLLDLMESAVASVEQSSGQEAEKVPAQDKVMSSSATFAPESRMSSKEPTGSARARPAVEEVPEVAGLELEVDIDDASTTSRFASGSAALLLGVNDGAANNVAAGRRPNGRIVGRTDAFDEAIKKSSSGGGSTSSSAAVQKTGVEKAAVTAGAAAPMASLGLTGLRKAYNSGVQPRPAEPSPNAAKAWSASAPEVTPGDEASKRDAGEEESSSKKLDPPAGSAESREGEDDDAELNREWDEIAKRTEEIAAKARETRGVAPPQQDVLSQPISYKEVTQWLLQMEIDVEALRPLQEEMVDDGRCGCMTRKRAMSDVPGLDKKLSSDKDLVLFLKITEFDFKDTNHHRMLRTMYSKLSRSKVCPTIGRHWEVLGFQGGDPRTDLNRSGGLLNVVQMFFFFSHHFDLLKAAYLLAQDVEQNFPLACVSINITRMVVECLLAGRLSKLCNSGEKGVFETTCGVYSGGLYHFYSRWRSQKRTIRDTELTFNEVRELMEKRPAKLLQGLEKGAEDARLKSDPSRLEFTDIDFGGSRRPPQAGPAQPPGRSGPPPAIPKRLRNYQDDSGTADVD